MELLKSLAPAEWLKEREPAIVSFLKSLTAKKGKSARETSKLKMSHVYEAMMGCRNDRFVGAFYFSENLVEKHT